MKSRVRKRSTKIERRKPEGKGLGGKKPQGRAALEWHTAWGSSHLDGSSTQRNPPHFVDEEAIIVSNCSAMKLITNPRMEHAFRRLASVVPLLCSVGRELASCSV